MKYYILHQCEHVKHVVPFIYTYECINEIIKDVNKRNTITNK